MMIKPRTKHQAPGTKLSQPGLITALCDAGYELDGFSRKGDTLVVRLTPTNLIEDGQHVAANVCRAAGLQSLCTVFEQVPQNLLILSVNLPEAAPKADSPKPNA